MSEALCLELEFADPNTRELAYQIVAPESSGIEEENVPETRRALLHLERTEVDVGGVERVGDLTLKATWDPWPGYGESLPS